MLYVQYSWPRGKKKEISKRRSNLAAATEISSPPVVDQDSKQLETPHVVKRKLVCRGQDDKLPDQRPHVYEASEESTGFLLVGPAELYRAQRSPVHAQ